jgi:hypothetical protein
MHQKIDFLLNKLLVLPSFATQDTENQAQVTRSICGFNVGGGLDLRTGFPRILGAGCLRDGMLYRQGPLLLREAASLCQRP